ncbi:MAG: hypothetical protein AAFW70_24345, partial [Cyanobacteria bacterium J06635_10]
QYRSPKINVQYHLLHRELETITREQRLQNGIPIPIALIETLSKYFGDNIVSSYLINSSSKQS